MMLLGCKYNIFWNFAMGHSKSQPFENHRITISAIIPTLFKCLIDQSSPYLLNKKFFNLIVLFNPTSCFVPFLKRKDANLHAFALKSKTYKYNNFKVKTAIGCNFEYIQLCLFKNHTQKLKQRC